MTGVDNFTGPVPSLVAEDVERIRRLLEAGATTRQVAEVMQIDRRTAYRYRHARISYVQAFGTRVALMQWEPGAPARIIDQRQRRSERCDQTS